MILFLVFFISLMSFIYILEPRLFFKGWKETYKRRCSMRRFIILVFVCLSVQGCSFYKHTLLTAEGDKLSTPIMGIFRAKGEGVKLKLDRTICIGGCNVKLH